MDTVKPKKGSGTYCAVRGCSNSWKRLNEWYDRECFDHQNFTKRQCGCSPPFALHSKPSTDFESRMWLKALNLQKPPKRLYVCSYHFVDKKPTKQNPFPELWLGSYERCTGTKKRKLVRNTDSQSDEMRGMECCVKNCGSSSHDHLGRTLLNGLSFHCFPAWRMEEGPRISELTKRRRAAWLAAVGRKDITFDRIPSSMRVCSRHFVSGKPAYEMLDSDPDWVPSLLMGEDVDDYKGEGTSGKKKQSVFPEEKPAEGTDGVVAGVRRPPPPPWKEVKSALQSLLEGKTVASQRPRDEEQNRAAGKRSDISFQEFFRNALESSLEASIQARARAKSRSSSAAYELKLNFKLPSPEGEPETRPKSSSCANCSGMLRRIEELERKLFELASKKKQRQEEASPARTRNSSEEEELTGYIEPVEVLDDGSEAESDSEAAPSSNALDPSPDFVPSTSRRPRAAAPRRRQRRHRFRKEWLKDFPFLRYSPSLDLMWCHVCRVYSDQFTRNHRLIKGSNTFARSNITQHTISHYHQQNMQRFVWSLQKSAERQLDQGSEAGLD